MKALKYLHRKLQDWGFVRKPELTGTPATLHDVMESLKTEYTREKMVNLTRCKQPFFNSIAPREPDDESA